MNITQALNVALPELPARLISQRPPRVHPEVVFQEHIEDGVAVVKVFVPGVDAMFTFPPASWKLIQLFDGRHSYSEIVEQYSSKTGISYSEETIRDFAAEVAAMNFWYLTPQEKNIRLMQKTAEERRRMENKSRWGDLSMIKFPAVNPNRFLVWIYQYLWFLYKPWVVTVCFIALLFMAGIFATHWNEVGRDTLELYNFADKSWFDIAVFWIVATILCCIHEIGHGLTCTHYGAPVPAMGFLLIYLTPAFYTDTTAGEVKANRFQRLMITVAGVWSELLVCALATPIWWGTPPNTPIHDLAYTIILFSGIGVVLINWNPLMKLDGYFIMCDLLGVLDLKEASTLYFSNWVKRHIWRLPVQVPYVPKRRRPGYVAYAVLSGLYSYSVLYVFAKFIGNIAHNFSPDWGFLFEYATAFMIFRGRLRTLWNFMTLVYLDKKDRIAAWFVPTRKYALSAAMILFALLPIWHETAVGRFVLEPAHMAGLRALIPGTVAQVFVDEGQTVGKGDRIMQLQNLSLESQAAQSNSELDVAIQRSKSALLNYRDLGVALVARERLSRESAQLAAEMENLVIRAPMAGVILTPRLKDRVGAYLLPGTELAEVADLDRLRARIYVSEFEMYKFNVNSPARLQVDGFLAKFHARTANIMPLSADIAPGLIDLSKYKGQSPPKFYVFDLVVDNASGSLRPGMIGTARVYGKKRSLASLAAHSVWEFFGRKFW
ncbi:MAG TPA: HlyD family efflux transporter periplasmic adaptor subunit [Candidatus Sulfotelmatobacter sp.]|jgi:putative peptide zinc metalloprotease protein|nr:HlyD family efflux transporter periplasmic adaptor subunit [Candidatus Sulfotelmatobacter sp.]